MNNWPIIVKNILSKLNFSLVFFYLFLFSLPFWRRLEIITGYSYLEERFIEYLTYSVYFFDVILIISLLFWGAEILKGNKKVSTGFTGSFLALLLLGFFAIISLFLAQSPAISLYYLFIFLGGLLVYFFTINKIVSKSTVDMAFGAIVASMALQGVIAIVQFIKNGYIGLHFLGEQLIGPQVNGVAKISIGGLDHIRSYGTFPHPNILAFFVILAGLFAIYLLFTADKKYRAYLIISLVIFIVALILSFSRISWLVGLIVWGLYYFSFIRKGRVAISRQRVTQYLLVMLMALVLILALIGPSVIHRLDPSLSSNWDSWGVRSIVLDKSWTLIARNPFGVGLGNFVIEVAYALTGYPVWTVEPVHNTYVLVWTELGFLGLFSFLAFLWSLLWSIWRKSPLLLQYVMATILILMLFDHFFWDMRQPFFLVMFVFGLISGHIACQKPLLKE